MANLTSDERQFLDSLSHGPVLRKMLDRSEIKLANGLAKRGLINKGTSDDKQKSVQFSKF